MRELKHIDGPQGEIFCRAFEAALALGQNPEAGTRLHLAVGELVRLGALFPDEATRFETLLTIHQGKFLLRDPLPENRQSIQVS